MKKIVTVKDIAREAGVSIGTVDRVLHNRGRVKEETKKSVEEAIERLEYKPNFAAQALAVRKKKLKICFFVPDFDKFLFFKDVYDAAVKKAEELKEYGVQIDIIKFYTEKDMQFQFKEEYEEYIEKKIEECDGIVTMGTNIPELNQYYKNITSMKKPIVFYNEKRNTENYLAFVGCDYVQSGRLAAGLCNLAGGNDSKICIFTQSINLSVDSFCKRLQGLEYEIAKHYPQMEIVAMLDIATDEKELYHSAKTMLIEHPDINIVYVVNPGNYEVCNVIHELDKEGKIKIITNDLVDRQIEMMKEGIIAATLSQEPQKQGSMSLEIMFRYLAFKQLPVQKDNFTNLSIHIAQNV